MSDSARYPAECYFEYKMERMSGDEREIKQPKLYFEKDYSTPDLPYTVFAVPEEWLSRQEIVNALSGEKNEDVVKKALSKLPYDTIEFVFDLKGIECAPLADKESEEYKKAEIHSTVKFEDFYRSRPCCHICIDNKNSEDHSGIGVMSMLKGGKKVAEFFFAVNFTFRKKIFYAIDVSGKSARLTFRCKDRPVGVEVKLVYNKDSIPCLKNDMGINNVESFNLDFTNSETFTREVSLSGEEAQHGNVFSLTFVNKDLEKFYILDCESNSSMPKPDKGKTISAISYTCPFCHKPINYSIKKDKNYKKGGTPCHSVEPANPKVDKKDKKSSGSKDAKESLIPTILDKHKAKLKKCLYCAEDLVPASGSLSFKPGMGRLLPERFMEHDNFKIAFTGSTRTGKTTYISRFFGITGSGTISMPMNMTSNALRPFGVTINSAPILNVSPMGGVYRTTDTNWTDTRPQYVERAINLNPPQYPDRTTANDCAQYPFIAEVNNSAYVSFYDIAGEDAQHSMPIKNIANEDIIGIFCLINGKVDVNGNDSVINMLKAANLNENCPVAVIVTKMDMLENEFDSNCHCLRTDYFDSGKIYEGSELEREIEISSEEIRAFLKHKGLVPDFEGKFKNIKYFGASSFNFRDSIHNELEDINTPGEVKFECSFKRMELPFLWMLKQFGLIR